jgi:CRISPR-associated exonuclease Cas4
MSEVIRLPSCDRVVDFELRVSDLRQWLYCPRVLWWTYICPLSKLESFKMRQGLRKEHRLQHLQKRRTLRAFALENGHARANVTLSSLSLRMHGRLDLLLEVSQRRYPVEIKYTLGPVRLNHRLQLAGYALLLEEQYGVSVPYGYVIRLPENVVERVEIDRLLRTQVRSTISEIRAALISERMPPPTAVANRCLDCEYRNYCGDVSLPESYALQFPESR